MTAHDIRVRIESALSPLRCVFDDAPDRTGTIRFRLLDGVGRETVPFALQPRELAEDDGFDAAIGKIMHTVEHQGFRHRR